MTTLPPSTSTPPTQTITVAIVGNPNTGKTTLFNALSGLHQRVGNYPGVTVEKKVGTLHAGSTTIRLIDLPGTYSLAARSPDEMVTVDLLLGHQAGESKPDLILNIVDASNLERHLFLTLQLAELGIPMVVAANLMDIAQSQGITLDFERIEKVLGMTVVPIEAHRKKGLDLLKDQLAHPPQELPHPVPYPEAFRRERQLLDQFLQQRQEPADERHPALLARLLIDRQGAVETRYRSRHSTALERELNAARLRLEVAGCSVPQMEARTKYAFLRAEIRPAISRPEKVRQDASARIDKVLTHRVWGLAIFLALLFAIFQSIFVGAEPLKSLLDLGIKQLGVWSTGWMNSGPLKSLIQDGIFSGVGGVISFLPQILILFGFLAILEDCGYMARAAFLMDKIMSRCGLSGKSFIPLLSSFACAIPGIMATRVIEDRRDRLATMLVAPLMSCSARLPVYSLLIGAFMPTDTWLGGMLPGLVLFGLYLLGIIIAPLVALGFKRTLLRGQTPIFILELPPYRRPSLFAVLHRMLERGWAFVRRAGTFILASMIVVWALLYFPRTDEEGQSFDNQAAELESQKDELLKQGKTADAAKTAEDLKQLHGRWKRQSYLGRVSAFLEPALTPLGWDWRIGTAALASFPAREVMVGVLGILFDAGDEEQEEGGTLSKKLQEAHREDGSGKKLFSVATALSVMVFFALCCQCASTLAVIARESNSWRWPLLTFCYMTLLAYLGALITYQLASRLGGA